jgi:hypothetical protein
VLEIRIRIIVGSKIRIRIKVKNSRAVEAQNGDLEEPWTLSMKAWRPRGPVGRPVIANCRTGIILM